MTNLLQFTINVRESHRQPQCSLHTACEDLLLFELIFTFLYAGSRMAKVSEQFISCIHLPFVAFALHPTTHTRARARARAHTHTHAHAHARTQTRARAHARTRAHAHTHTRTHAHTQTHTQSNAVRSRYSNSSIAVSFQN